MNRIKSDWRSSLSRDRLDTLLRISEEGPCLEDFDPDKSIDIWYSEKVRRLSSGPHNYPSKRKKSNEGSQVIVLATLTLSDLENEDNSDEEEFFRFD